jgi:hypothetical protein
VAGFDAELYLRTTGEEMILGLRPKGQRPWDSPLFDEAEALVAVGAISAARAGSVIDDYSLAEAVRSGHWHHFRHRMPVAHVSRSRPSQGTTLKPRRSVPCDHTIEDSSGALLVRHVTLTEDTTSVAITWRPNRSGWRRWRSRRQTMVFGHGPAGPVQPQLTDDRGTTVGTWLGGRGPEEEWDGLLTADQPLAPDTAWIEIDGDRLELTDEPVACEVRIESLPEEPTALGYLWRRLALTDFHGPPEVEGSIDALIAAGAVEPDDPLLSQIRAVKESMPDHPVMPSGGHPYSPQDPRRSGRGSVPEPWRSLLRRQESADGPEGTLAIGAVAPEFEGFSVAVIRLESRSEGFGIEVDVAPRLEGRGRFGGLGFCQLAWWAADERGNRHLGSIWKWTSEVSYSSGEVNFWPALRATARRLSIMPTGERSRAVITVPLTWDDTETSSEQERS